MLIFDSHAHYDDERFNEDRAQLLSSMNSCGIGKICNIGASIESSKRSISLSNEYPFIYAAIGVHPESANEINEESLLLLERMAKENPKVVAIGEIGLDFHYEDSFPKEIQIYAFEKQLELAKKLDLPVVIHSRDAAELTYEMVKKHRPRGVVHCFSGSAEQAREYVKLGMYVGFTGVCTFKNAKKPLEAAIATGLDHLLIETDCPYLAPEPKRGKRNDSTNLAYLVDCLSNAFNVSKNKLIDVTYQNACSMYGIKD